MSKLNFNYIPLDNYVNLLTKLSKQAKLYLIEKLQNSLEEKPENNESNSLFGIWKGKKSSEQILEEIRSSRSFRNREKKF
jgi:hypothetical protein